MSIQNPIKRLPLLTGILLFICACQTKAPQDDRLYTGDLFHENIRSTDPRTPEEERQGFKLPPGFEIQLFASEPDIDKPVNMAFDAKGRMWVTQSFEYPFPSPPGKKSTDKLTILEDTDHDGRADKFTLVSDSLNIPIGLLPLSDGHLSFSVPHLYRFTDADGDEKPEGSRILLGPFGYEDTHGMVSNFIRGYDGWVHACHGFTNLSTVAGRDGDSIRLQSGNTFRFRLDGSRVEQMTFGQVNPFGLAYDERGYIYSTDSHTSPLYQLIRGADYPHFSKPEIMAFGPDMKPLENEATALCGIAYYGDTQFPEEFQGNFFIGDALISRVHRYSWTNKGSTPLGKSETDFIQSADPWFRPVNIKLGPDGALYVADFYNAIIGHYEVPLGHPKRDKQRGRIWRITYKGNHHDLQDLTQASIPDLLATLDADNISTRMAAADQLTDRFGEAALAQVRTVLDETGTLPRKYIHALWVTYRLGGMDDALLNKSLVHDSPLVRLHSLRILREWKPGDASFQSMVARSLNDPDAHVQRAAAELLSSYPEISSVESALQILRAAPAEDTHLRYTARLNLRNLLRVESLMKTVAAKEWNEQDAGHIAGTLVDVHSADAALFLSNHLARYAFPKEKIQLAYQQIMRFLPASKLDEVIRSAGAKQAEADLAARIFRGVKDGLAQRGGDAKTGLMQSWGTEIAKGLIQRYPADSISRSLAPQQLFAIQLAGEYKIRPLQPELVSFVENNPGHDLKTAALSSLMKMSGDRSTLDLASKWLMSDSTPVTLKKNIATVLGESPGSDVNKILLGVTNAPADLEVVVATALAGSPEGKDLVLQQVRNGAFKARTLIDPRVEEKMLFRISPQQQKTYSELTAHIEPISEERQGLIEDRLEAFKLFKASPSQVDTGARLFNANCGICHRRQTESGIGPQLHGIGKRGANAIAEKILDPNRNITEAFRNYTIKLKDGKILTGLYRGEQGAVVIFGDLTGKEFSIRRADIVEQKPSRYTIMPDHFGTTLTQHEFNMLLSYVLTW
ncbi:MAG TPA: hypothetical protein PKM27_01630 [Saprospiraceae bacterium]|nr:hypothetical protein [Saprospiraceae bacterium]HNT20895.1 hypothetical protein [Saprospiraceae bacterium]